MEASTPGAAMDGFFELFQPGYKHLREERDRKRLEAQIPETGAPPFGIDLDSGVARISLRTSSPEQTPPASPDTSDDG
ncbi:MAG TPA: DUF6191 domain-containing protein [Actinomycetales bacterium]|nr:DUF6191 domain-containing protein [Actinomycetales bacterium]